MTTSLEEMLKDYEIPPVAKVQVLFDRTRLEQVEETLLERLQAKDLPIRKGQRIAITGGSRGIADYVNLMKAAVAYIKGKGAIPFIVPAMGSHGGATAEGQVEVLRNLGITEESVGAPIISSMDVVEVARTELDLPVYIDKNAYEADGILLLNRVKTHTSIYGKYQSGLVKMLAIGLAKHVGAAMTHSLGTDYLNDNMARVGLTALRHVKVVGGIAAIENGYDQLADVYVLHKEEIETEEPKILVRAKNMVPRIPFDHMDVLICRKLGKEISGTGMDPAIVGRPINNRPNVGPDVTELGILRLTDKSEGNANGMGMGDFISRKLRSAVNEKMTVVNALTGMKPFTARIPPTMDTDKLVFQACIKAAGRIAPDQLKLCIINSTGDLQSLWATRPLVKELDPGRGRQIGEFQPVAFDGEGNLVL
ncbi:DUF362 domain-containing protein [Acidaminococcus sp.]|uniref:DUF362 domain-containing protein n=1 Tax=Acidaminococcus sp. TaxID=1872103 RepID=UPI003D7CC8FB